MLGVGRKPRGPVNHHFPRKDQQSTSNFLAEKSGDMGEVYAKKIGWFFFYYYYFIFT